MGNAREVAFEALNAVEANDAYLNLVLPRLLKKVELSSADSAFATELAYGTARWQGFYDWVIERASGRSVQEIDADALVIIRIGAHQLLELKTPAHAAIYEMVDLTKKRLKASVSGFVNAALRRISERSKIEWIRILEEADLSEDEFLSIKYSHPFWVTKSLKQALRAEDKVAELEDSLASDNVPPKVSLVQLPGKQSEMEQALSVGTASPIGLELSYGDPSRLKGVSTGALRVQDQGSQLTALALAEVKPVTSGEQWLDLCAGPGGKAVLLAALAKQKDAVLTTNEISEHRAKLVDTALRHSGFEVMQLQKDGRNLGLSKKFDRILLDAPCTGLGALRRRPESRWRKNAEGLKELSSLQRELIQSAWMALKPGGVLAYVTCSPHPTETTSQVEWLLRTFKDSVLLNATETVLRLNPSLEVVRSRKTVQLWPHRNGTDAMFLGLIEKKGE